MHDAIYVEAETVSVVLDGRAYGSIAVEAGELDRTLALLVNALNPETIVVSDPARVEPVRAAIERLALRESALALTVTAPALVAA
jgi:hypothetical protein